ncbi:unnamed protein product [Leuciscus chuanchicus]
MLTAQVDVPHPCSHTPICLYKANGAGACTVTPERREARFTPSFSILLLPLQSVGEERVEGGEVLVVEVEGGSSFQGTPPELMFHTCAQCGSLYQPSQRVEDCTPAGLKAKRSRVPPGDKDYHNLRVRPPTSVLRLPLLRTLNATIL